MQVLHRIADLQHPALHVGFVLRPVLAHESGKRLAGHVVHHHVDEVLGLLHVGDAHDVRVVDTRQDFPFADERLLDRVAVGVLGVAVDLFDGPLLVGHLKVARQPNTAHAAFVDHTQDFVFALEDVAFLQAPASWRH